ncbi:sulfite exporter TauE/SafE family protein, partial [Klebsiella pneumoniae]|uniref:sulfite exporter TauE/SafE family protein n=1 Tax=Klebsiella pneumoniae TaxID=573 RepID=UPI003A88D860
MLWGHPLLVQEISMPLTLDFRRLAQLRCPPFSRRGFWELTRLLTWRRLGGALALMGVPLMALAIPPVQAAAIFLPILIVMDLVALWAWRHHNHRQTLLIMLPGAIAGITLGWAT